MMFRCIGILLPTLILIWLSSVTSSVRKYITPLSFIVLDADVTVRDLDQAFDNNQTSPSLVYSDISQKIRLLLRLPAEYQIASVEILSDIPSQLKQSISVGYATDASSPSPSLTYECVPNATSTLCQPSCIDGSTGSEREGVVGRTVLWTLERLDKKDWTRIYDVVIRGRPFSELLTVKDKVADIVFLKPYYNRALGTGYEKESCLEPVWKLTDSSNVNPTMEPISKFNRNVTIYFGGSYSVTKLALVVSEKDEVTKELTLRFDGRKPMAKTLDLGSDCSASDGQVHCSLQELEDYSFSDLTLDVKGLIRLHIYGIPVYYPQLSLIASPRSMRPEDGERLELECAAHICGSNNAIGMLGSIPMDYCKRLGRNVGCAHMELMRLHEPRENGRLVIPDALLVANGKVTKEAKEWMTELDVIESTSDRLTVSLPRTHPYYGQYKCRCEAQDALFSLIESSPSELGVSEFDQGDLVFQRNYTAVNQAEHIEEKLGFIFLPENQQAGYFRLMVGGHSLFEDIKLNVSFNEQGTRASVTGQYAVTTAVQAFPRAVGAKYAWPIPAYKMELQEAYPDYVDNQLIEVKWQTLRADVSKPVVEDILRTIVIPRDREEAIRVWLWKRDVQQLDIRAYYQTEPSVPVDKEIYIQRKSCDPQQPDEKVAWVKLTDESCTPQESSKAVSMNCLTTDSGYIMQFLIKRPSASDEFTLYETNGTSPNQLLHSPRLVENLQNELDRAEISVSILTLTETEEEDQLAVKFGVLVHSKILVDNSLCQPMFIKLGPIWSVAEQPEIQMKSSQTEFTLDVPKTQNVLTMDVTISVQSDGVTESPQTSKRSISTPNPLYFDANLKLDHTESELQWSSIPLPLNDIYKEFDVKVYRTLEVCGTLDELHVPYIKSSLNNGNKNVIRLSDIPDYTSTLSVTYKFQVTPVFSANEGKSIRGQTSEQTVTKGVMDKSTVHWDEKRSHRTARLYVTPSQTAMCLRANPAMIVKFDLQVVGRGGSRPSYLDHVEFVADEGGEDATDMSRWYTIKNLQPGRQYQVNATVLYPTGVHDEPSVRLQFQTNDEITVNPNQVFASPGDQITFNCSGTVGPNDGYQKHLEWKRSDGTPVPDGVIQETVTQPSADNDWKETISLSFERTEKGQGAVYACFIQPSMLGMMGEPEETPTVTLIISSLELSEDAYQATMGEMVTVNCTSHQPGDLIWTGPNKEMIQLNKGQDVFVYTEKTESGITLVLNIRNVKLIDTGKYDCAQLDTRSQRSFKLHFKGDLNIYQADDTSNKAGGKLHLNCTAHLGTRGQTLQWFKRAPTISTWSPLTLLRKTDPSIQLWTSSVSGNSQNISFTSINSPDSVGEYACALRDDHQQADHEVSELPATVSKITVGIIPTISSIDKRLTPDGKLVLRCNGYPAAETDRLQWVFVPQGKEVSDESSTIQIRRDVVGSNDPLEQSVSSNFILGENIPASWPGLSSPLMLAAADKVAASNDETTPVTPERLELIIESGKPDFKLPDSLYNGTLSCQYKPPDAVVQIGEGTETQRVIHPRNTGMLHEDVQLSTVFDPNTKKPVSVIEGSGSKKSGNKAPTVNGHWFLVMIWMKLVQQYL